MQMYVRRLSPCKHPHRLGCLLFQFLPSLAPKEMQRRRRRGEGALCACPDPGGQGHCCGEVWVQGVTAWVGGQARAGC